jgi:hypothetical protein
MQKHHFTGEMSRRCTILTQRLLHCTMDFYDTRCDRPFEIIASLLALVVDSPATQAPLSKPQAREAAMKKLLVVMFAGLFALGSAYAADTKTDMKKTDAMNPQQNKMKECNDQAGDKKGDDRKAFMKTCLSAKPAKKESKIAMCNKKTAGMKGDERAKAQSECMKG